MKSNLKKIKDCRVKLTVEVESKLVEDRFGEILRHIQKQARLPGFREGKAPFDLVEKRFSEEAREEVLKSLIPEAYHQSVAAQKISPVSLPSIQDIRLERGKSLTFSAEFDRRPDFTLRHYKGISLKRPGTEVTDADVEKAMASLVESRAELLPLAEPRGVQKGDFIVADIEIWKDGAYVPGRKEVLLFVEANQADDFFDQVLGAKESEVREVSVKAADPGGTRQPHYKLWVRAIKERKLPALDEAFAKGFGKNSPEELREAVRQDLSRLKHSESMQAMKQELFQKLLGLVSFSLPESLVEKQKEALLEETRRQRMRSGMTEQQFAQERDKMAEGATARAGEQVKIYFILEKVAELEHLDVDEEALGRKLEDLGRESGRPMEEIRRMFEDDLRHSMRESKVVDFLIAHAKLEEDKK